MDYSKLSDFEINCSIAEVTGHKPLSEEQGYAGLQEGNITAAIVRGPRKIGGFDPCNEPADAWPIISANRISVEYDSEDQCDAPVEWVTAYGIDGLKVHVVAHQPCDKALRSAMIVFLMMHESDQSPS